MTGFVIAIGTVAVGLLGFVAGWLGGYQHGLHDWDRAMQRELSNRFRLDRFVDDT